MSRSLDSAVVRRLKVEDPKPVYDDVVRVLTELPANDDQLLEIEILGADHHALEAGVHFLRDGPAVAIPKLRAAQAFFIARRVLEAHLRARRSGAGEDSVVGGGDELVRATAALLLMDPEHLTAANVRKRFLLSELRSPGPGAEMDVDRPRRLLRRELQFVDSLLTAHLHRHTKSPTLWAHRRWVLGRCAAAHGIAVPVDEARAHLRRVALVAAERHPRNYYAWDHARWLFRDPATAAVSAAVVGEVKTWCFRHPSDTSGWSFLAFLLLQGGNGGSPEPGARQAARDAVIAETLELTAAFRWAHESVWVFLRTMAAHQDRPDAGSGSGSGNSSSDGAFVAVNEKLCSMLKEQPDALRVLRKAKAWLDEYGLPAPVTTPLPATT